MLTLLVLIKSAILEAAASIRILITLLHILEAN
jgi:hypothetical protein